jgi:phytoene/squalene synthetase
MRFQAERAHRLYDEALALLPDADRRAQKPGLMMASIYRTLLREIEHENFQVLHQRIASRRCASSGWRGRCRRWGVFRWRNCAMVWRRACCTS